MPSLIGMEVEATCPVRPLRAKAGHVIGEIKGTNPALDRSPLIVGAHFDGVSDDPAMRIPCAGDNAAAVAVLLEIARLLMDVSFERSILFAALDCEEVHALGSGLYVEQLQREELFPLVINLDGAANLNETISVEVGPGADDLVNALDWEGELPEIPLITDSLSSDNRQFARVGFPAVGIGAGTGTSNIHSPADTLDKVNLHGTFTTAQLLLATIIHLAGGTHA